MSYTQPLHVAPSPLGPLRCFVHDMSPRWGFRIFVCPVFYKHVAPLGLNEPTNFKPCRQTVSLGTSGCG